MMSVSLPLNKLRTRLRPIADRLLMLAGTAVIPLIVVISSLLAVMFWQPGFEGSRAQPVRFSWIEQDLDGNLPSAQRQAAQALDLLGMVVSVDTRFSQTPFWLRFEVPAGHQEPVSVSLPSRHAHSLRCWDQAHQPLGMADRLQEGQPESRVRLSRAGFAMDLPASAMGTSVLCQASFRGPARITLESMPSHLLKQAEQEFVRRASLVEGGILMLTAFTLLVALFSRDWTHVLFAAWLVANLRVAALTMGWDTLWLGFRLPPDWVVPARTFAVAGYATLTAALLLRLFPDREGGGVTGGLRDFIRVMAVLMPVAWLVLPAGALLVLVWASSLPATLAVLVVLAHAAVQERSRVAIWYGLALSITLMANLQEVVVTALRLTGGIDGLNSVTAALTSSLLAAMAIAEQIRVEREHRLHAEAASAQALSRVRDTYEASPVGLFSVDGLGRIVGCNEAFRRLFGLPDASCTQLDVQSLLPADPWRAALARLEGERHVDTEMMRELSQPDGSTMRQWVQLHLAWSGGVVECAVQDVTERRVAVDRLRFLADHDPLTDLLNRRGAQSMLADALAARDVNGAMALAFIDLDRFKLVNDLYGHAAGDEVLKQISLRIRAAIGPEPALARLGGDEFLILFRNMGVAQAEAICQGVLAAISTEPVSAGEQAFRIDASLGLVELSSQVGARDAVATADQACREAKSRPDHALVVYRGDSPALRETIEQLRMAEHVSRGLPLDRLLLEMQPIVNLAHPFESHDFEVLLRMRDDDGRIQPPRHIIAAAEKHGKMGLIDRWVLAHVLEWLSTHGTLLARTRFVCVNLSGSSLNDTRFLEDCYNLLERYPDAARKVCIEITETVALHDMRHTRAFIERLQALGARVALDDFGAGYTSFSYLRELPADAIKIDGEFVRTLRRHPANIAIVGAIVELARTLGMSTVAEWVEDRETIEQLLALGVDYVQGWAVGRPQTPQAMVQAHAGTDFITDTDVLKLLRTHVSQSRGVTRHHPLRDGVQPRRVPAA